ncbi:MAG TPA: hypothetical protein VFG14_19820 [Chthoniobacteraceae bacterium]|nr:hypothetical protein [Chthoniobacteraceae bacterium]
MSANQELVRNRRTNGRAVTVLLAATSFLLANVVRAQLPAWWHAQNVHGRSQYTSSFPLAQDYTVANLGQTKWLATRAYSQLVSSDIPALNLVLAEPFYSDSLSSRTGSTADFASLNLGQLKNVRSLLYDTVPLTIPTPPAGSVTSDYALANNGQLKSVFDFPIGQDWHFPISGDITIPPELPPNTPYSDPLDPSQSRRQTFAREREYKLVVDIAGLPLNPSNGFTAQSSQDGGRRTRIDLPPVTNWGERLNVFVRNALTAHQNDGDWLVPGMQIVGPGSPSNYGAYLLENVDREINLDVYFDDGCLNLYRQNGSARLRQRFSGMNRFMDRLRYYLTGHYLSQWEDHAHSRLEYQVKLDETEVPVPDFPNAGDGYSEVTQTRLFIFGNTTPGFETLPLYRDRTELFTKLIPGYQAGCVLWPPSETNFANIPPSLVGRAIFRALGAAHGSYNSPDRLLRPIPSAVIVGQRHRQHLLATNGVNQSGGFNSQQLLIITTDITYVYDPATFFSFMRTSAADDDLPPAMAASAEIEVQVEDQIWTRHVDSKRLPDGSYPPDALADYAKLQSDMRKARDIIETEIAAIAAPITPGLVGIGGGVVSKYRQAINALGRDNDNSVYLAGRILPKLSNISIAGGNSVSVGLNQDVTVVPIGADQSGQRIFPNGGWKTVVTPGGASLSITPIETIDMNAPDGRTRLEAFKIRGLTTGTASVTVSDPGAGLGSPTVVLNVTVN